MSEHYLNSSLCRTVYYRLGKRCDTDISPLPFPPPLPSPLPFPRGRQSFTRTLGVLAIMFDVLAFSNIFFGFHV